MIRRRWGLVEMGDGGARCPAIQLIRRGIRPRTKARMDWHGAWLGNDDDRPMRAVSGSGLPARLFREIALELH